MLLKNKLIQIVIIVGLLLIAIFAKGLYGAPTPTTNESNISIDEKAEPKLVKTNPENLNGATVAPTQKLEITFNKALVRDDPKIVLEPKIDINIELNDGGKTLVITPLKPFELGTTYVLTIKKDYGFNSGEKLKEDLIFNFQTIPYNGV